MTYAIQAKDHQGYRGLWFFYHLNAHKIFLFLFLSALVCQLFFWKKTENVKPSFDIVPPAPNKYFTSAASLGDNEFLFYVLATRFQNSGDVFAGFAPLKKYDYSRLYDWMKRLDELNSKSHLVPALASYYYAQTQTKSDTRYIVDYLDEHITPENIKEKWWWLVQAIYISKDYLGDKERAVKLAYKLGNGYVEGVMPVWALQMPAFISKDVGDGCSAFFIIKNLLDEAESGKRKFTANDMNFMRQFINERLSSLKKLKFNPHKCASRNANQR